MPRKIAYFASVILGLWVFGYSEAPQNKCAMVFDAVRKDNLKQVLFLLEKGFNVNCRGEHNYTPIIIAAKYNRYEIVRALCARGAEINISADSDETGDEMGFTPLLWAAWNCNIDMAELLISHGASVSQRGKNGDTPLLIAARKDCLPLAKIFIENGAPIDDTHDANGDTALVEAVSRGFLDLANYLIEQGADVQRKDQAERSLLGLAAYMGHFAEVRYFCEKGIPINERDRIGQTAIHYAANDRIESRYILDYLIKQGGDLSAKSMDGTSPLMMASYRGANITVDVLISNGAAVNEVNSLKETPLHLAGRGIHDSASPQEINKRRATIKSLLDGGARVNVQDRKGKTPLMEAAGNPDPQIVGSLLECGALVNVQDNDGWTALMYATDRNRIATINLLVRHGADLDLRNVKGNTALDVAKNKKGSADAYALLKRLGARTGVNDTSIR
jgi:ankyrin repeat protein